MHIVHLYKFQNIFTLSCSNHITGIGGDTTSATVSSETCTNNNNKYNGVKGISASTTGNVTGIYDMSGGSFENVMGNLSSTSQLSGFNSDWFTNNKKYYDKYKIKNISTGYIKGDATYETSGWYDDSSTFFNEGNWFSHGGSRSMKQQGGIFNCHSNLGRDYTSDTFRLALTRE